MTQNAVIYSLLFKVYSHHKKDCMRGSIEYFIEVNRIAILQKPVIVPASMMESKEAMILS